VVAVNKDDKQPQSPPWSHGLRTVDADRRWPSDTEESHQQKQPKRSKMMLCRAGSEPCDKIKP
jgi:hypothetical protein